MDEVKLILNCGVAEHDEDCLCDVVVTEPVQIMDNWIRDSWMASKIVQYAGLSAPYSNEDILTLLSTQVAMRDEMQRQAQTKEQQRRAARIRHDARKTLFTKEQMEEVRQLLASGMNTTQVRVHCKVKWDIDLKKSYASKIQARLKQKDTK